MRSLLAEQQVDHPAAAHVWSRLATVVEDGGVVAAGGFEGVGEGGKVVEGALRVDCLGEPMNGPVVPAEPGQVGGDAAEGITEYVPQASTLVLRRDDKVVREVLRNRIGNRQQSQYKMLINIPLGKRQS